MQTYTKDNVSRGELNLYKVLSTKTLQDYNNNFATLMLPKAVKIDSLGNTLTLPFYEGNTFDSDWSRTNGGATMDLVLVEKLPYLLKDLSNIDITHITQNALLAKDPKLAFDHQHTMLEFSKIAKRLHDAGHIVGAEVTRIVDLLDVKQKTKLIVNNGDFYPRNFIQRDDGRIILIDWETWDAHSPFHIIDHPENVAAVQYVHMWGNSKWQRAYRQKIQQHFSFPEESFDKGIVIKALTLAHFFPKYTELFSGQIKIIKTIVQKN